MTGHGFAPARSALGASLLGQLLSTRGPTRWGPGPVISLATLAVGGVRPSTVQHLSRHIRTGPHWGMPGHGFRVSNRRSAICSSAVDRDLVDDLAVSGGHDDVRRLYRPTVVAVIGPPDVRHECRFLDTK